ncbi:Hypothetical predicted protein [Olea europaea subsp. europaea]|uniref:Uncharacterized protein n=1 Tax=Olea europaea subsp. europaea TaxID=158383 RepID=A0A8S0VJ07_OLEEU|nr:Hypothetical predicted protein [Olea europaea subsp. europaea]
MPNSKTNTSLIATRARVSNELGVENPIVIPCCRSLDLALALALALYGGGIGEREESSFSIGPGYLGCQKAVAPTVAVVVVADD